MPGRSSRFGAVARCACCLALLSLSLLGCSRRDESGKETLRIVRSKQLTPLAVLEKQGSLERALAPSGLDVEWLEFAAGPQQLEALNAGALDIAETAESPPIFAQAAGDALVYLAKTFPSGKTVSLLVRPEANIKKIRDLAGKKIAFQKASIGHYLLVRALATEGLTLKDVQQIFLPPPDAIAAFSEGAVDAWFVWEPYVTRTVQAELGSVLLDGETLRDTTNFYSVNRAFFEKHRDALKIFLRELQGASRWSRAHPKEMAELLTNILLIDVPTLLEVHAKYDFGVLPLDEATVAQQQRVADLWYALGFLPVKVDVRRGMLPLEQYQELVPPL